MRSAKTTLVVFSLLLFVGVTQAGAIERTAYVWLADGNELVRFSLPSTPPAQPVEVHPTVVGSVEPVPAGSTKGPANIILTPLRVGGELLAIDPTTGEVETLSTLSAPIYWEADLFWYDGELIFENGFSDLFTVEPATGQLTYRGTIGVQDMTTISYHQGQLYAGYRGKFARIDLETLEVTDISFIGQPFAARDLCGLSSVGDTLWYGIRTCWAVLGYGSCDLEVGTIDPVTGDRQAYAVFHGVEGELFNCFEVIEQPSPAQVPVLQRTGILMLILGFAVAGGLMLWRR